MRKAGRIVAVLIGMLMVFGAAISVRAQEEIKSRGTFRFQSTEGTVQMLAEDILLLQDKTGEIREEGFDAAYY